jgi:uncharacterized protein (TIGR03437 family)
LIVGIASTFLPAFGEAPQPANWVVLFQDNFSPPANNWQVWGADATDNWQLAQDGSETVYSGQGYAWLNLTGRQWNDYRFASQIKLLRDGVILNYRLTSVTTRYFVSLQTGGLRFSKSTDSSPAAVVVASDNSVYSLGTWYEVEIVGIGGDIKTYVNGVLKMEYVDPAPLTFGGINFSGFGDTLAEVANVEVSGPPSPVSQPWVKVGGPLGGIGYDIKMRPDNPDVMFVTDAYAGVNKSVDGGQTWFASNSGITTRNGVSGDAIPIYCLTIDPNDPDIVWTGMQNARGIFKSTDGGNTWVEKDQGVVEPFGISFRGIAVDPHNSNIVYAAAQIDSAEWSQTPLAPGAQDTAMGVVYRSLDGGASWNAIWRGDNLARYVWIDPTDSNVIYVSTGIFDTLAANSNEAAGIPGGLGVVKTTDGGQTWTTLGPASGLLGTYVGSLFMHPQNPDILLAGVGQAFVPQPGGVYITTDGGQNWKVTLNGSQIQPPDQITAVKFALSNPSIAYAAGFNAFYRSVNGGLTWSVMSGGPANNVIYGPPGVRTGIVIDIQVDPRNPNRLFINAYGGGAFLSEDGGATWQMSSKGYTGAELTDVAVDPRDPSRVYAIGRSGIFRSDDLGADWLGLDYGPATFSEWASLVLDPNNPDTVLISDDFQGVMLMSKNAGLAWNLIFRSSAFQPSSTSQYAFNALAFAPSNSQTIYAGMSQDAADAYSGTPGSSFGIWKSTDGGNTWQASNDSNTAHENIMQIAVDPHSESVAYAASANSGVFRTADRGASWQLVSQGPAPKQGALAIAIDPTDSSVLYAAFYNGGVYKTTDGGATWQIRSTGMDPQITIWSIVIDPTDSQRIYAGSPTSGVYCSVDGGTLWVQINNGLGMRAVTALAISSDASELYAGTQGGGVYRLDLKPGAAGSLAALSAASFAAGGPAAPESIVSVYGQGLAAGLVQAEAGALPTALGDTQVSVTDAAGFDYWAPLYFVSPGQINLVMPAGIETGTAQVRVFLRNQVVARTTVQVNPTAPGIFTANASGQGVPAALAARYGASGSPTAAPVFQCGALAGSCVPVAMDLGTPDEQLIVMLYGTGIRGYKSLPEVTIGGVAATVLGAAAQSQYAGLDQVNVLVPRALQGSGDVQLLLTVDGQAANAVNIRIL